MPARTQTKGAAPATTAAGRRRSTRISSTGKTSRYFEEDDVNDEDKDDDDAPAPRGAKAKKHAVDPEDSNEVDGAQFSEGSDAAEEEEADSADDGPEGGEAAPPSRKRSRGRPAKAVPKKKAKRGGVVEADDSGAPTPRKRGRPPKAAPKTAAQKRKQPVAASEPEEDASEDEDEAESRFTFEPLPPLRDAGGIAYEDTRVHPNTLAFLKDLKANNKRSWLKARDPEYRRSLKDWETFVETLTDKIIEADETVPELPLKDVIFRIYRDIRFSKDPTPYKPHYSAAWSRTGRKGPYACYYVHCEPGRCLVGGGLWHPDKAALARLRASIDERPRRWRRALLDAPFGAAFLLPRTAHRTAAAAAASSSGNAGDEEEEEEAEAAAFAAARAAFAAANRDGALKKRPQGFHPDHRDIDLLKLRNFTVSRTLRDADFTAADAQDRIMDIVRPMVNFVTFLNRVVMPDPGEDSSSEEESEANGPAGDEDEDEEDEEET